jgi:hypothetical protein
VCVCLCLWVCTGDRGIRQHVCRKRSQVPQGPVRTRIMARGRGDGKREEEEEGGSSLPLLPPSVSVSVYLCLTSSYDNAHRAWSAAVHVVSGMYATGAQQYSSIRNCFRLIGYVYGLKQAGGLWLPLPNNPPLPLFHPADSPSLFPSSQPPPSPPRVRVPALHLSRCQPRRTNEPRTAPHKRGSVFRV